jgi:hypothetical protein
MADLAATLAACILGIEVCGNVLVEGVAYAHRPYPRVEWDQAASRLETGDLLVATPGVRCRPDVVALVLRDISGVLYAITARSTPVPLVPWVQRKIQRGAQCTWRPLRMAHAGRGGAHGQVIVSIRPREDAFKILLRAGILSSSSPSLNLINCNTAPGFQYDPAVALDAPPDDLERR